MTERKRDTRAREAKLSGAEAYRVPNATCATCGKPTSSRSGGESGYGAFHFTCKRDRDGHLLLRPT